MGRAADAGIGIKLFVGEFEGVLGGFGLGLHNELVLQGVHALVVLVLLQLDNLFAVLGCQPPEDVLLLYLGQTLGHHLQLIAAVNLAGHDVELAAAAATLGVHLVARACGGECATLVEVLGIDKLGLDGVAGVSVAQRGVGASGLAVAVTGLNHKVLDNAVEKHAVIVT